MVGGLVGAAGARLSWSGLFSLPWQPLGAQDVLSGQKWQAQERRAASSQALSSPHPTAGGPASPGSWATYL